MQATQASAHTDLGRQVKSLSDTDVILDSDVIIHMLSYCSNWMNRKPFSYNMYTVHASIYVWIRN